MKKVILAALLFMATVAINAQQQVDSIRIKSKMRLGAKTVTAISTDTTEASLSDDKLITEAAAKKYARSFGGGGAGIDTTKVPYTGANQPLISPFYIQGSSLRTDTLRAASTSGFRMFASNGSEIASFGAGGTILGSYVGKQSYRTNINGSLSGNDFTTQGALDSVMAYKASVDALEDTAADLRNKISADSTAIAAINARQDDTLNSHNTRILANQNAVNTLDALVVKLGGSQTITGDKVTTGLFTVRHNNVGSSNTSRFVLENQTAAPAAGNVQNAPIFEIAGNVYAQLGGTTADGSTVSNGNNEARWRFRHLTVAGDGSSLNSVDNILLIEHKLGSGSWVERARFNKTGFIAAQSFNTLTLGSIGNNGTLNLRRSSDGSGNGQLAATSSGGAVLSGNDVLFSVPNGNAITFSGGASFGMRYQTNAGLYITNVSNSNAFPSSMLVVANGGASIGANVAAPANGFVVAGESIFTSTRTAYTATAVDLTLSASHSVVSLTTTGLTITLPTAVGITGRTYTIINESSGSNTIATTSTQLIGNFTTATTYTLLSDGSVTLVSNGTKWVIKSKF